MSPVNNSNLKFQSSNPIAAENASAEKSEDLESKIAAFEIQFKDDLNQAITQIEQKYQQQIDGFEKRGINSLTKKLIEKTQSELVKAKARKTQEMLADKQLKISAIRMGEGQSDVENI